MKKRLLQAWNSPTLMSWGSLAARLGGFAITLPLVLRAFTPAELAVWLLFATIASLQIIGDVGFSQTFTRAFAFAYGGAHVEELADARVTKTHRPSATLNIDTLQRIFHTIGPVYLKLSVIAFLVLLCFGSLALQKPITALSNYQSDAWLAWAIVLVSTTASLWGNIYTSYLQGSGRIALLRRWEMLTAIAGIISVLIVLLAGGGLLEVVLAQQIWMIVSVVRNNWLCKNDENFKVSPFSVVDSVVFSAVWPSAWRSGIGVLMSFGIIQFSGIAYAQVVSTVESAKYLFALRVIQIISQFSQAPFYSKLPELARLRSQGLVAEQLILAKKGMRFAHWTFVTGFLSVLLLVQPILSFIGSKTQFVSMNMWILMGAGYLAERVGAMHIQLYSTTNHIIWHIANGLTGCAMLLLSVILYSWLGAVALPLAMLVSYLCIYTPMAIYYSSRAFEFNVLAFEFKVSFFPIVAFVLVIFIVFSSVG